MARQDDIKQLEARLYGWACGTVTTAQLKRDFRSLGWSVDLRTMRNNWVDAVSPGGEYVTLYC